MKRIHPHIFDDVGELATTDEPPTALVDGVEGEPVGQGFTMLSEDCGFRAAFVQGEGPLAKLPTLAWRLELREAFEADAPLLRRWLLEQYGSDDPATVLLVDGAVLEFFRSRWLMLSAASLLDGKLTGESTRTATRLDAMAGSAHNRFLAAVAALRRGVRYPVKISVRGDIANLNTGTQSVDGSG